MPGSPVSIGCSVLLSPGAAGPPDSGTIIAVTQAAVVAGGLPLAVAGSTICLMVNSVSGVPYSLPIASGGSTSVSINGQGMLRMGDVIPAGPGLLTLLG